MDNKMNLPLSETEVKILKWVLKSKRADIIMHLEMAKQQNVRTDEVWYTANVETIEDILNRIERMGD